MKALITTLFIISFGLFTTGCQTQSMEENNEGTDILNPENQRDTADPELSAKLGYVRYTADEINQGTEAGTEITIDRTQMADIITRMLLRSGSFEEVASLVTDKEVVIAYERNPEIDEQIASDIASKTAASILPSFYRTYTTDNPLHMDDIHSLHLSTTDNKSDKQVIDGIINEVGKKHGPNRR